MCKDACYVDFANKRVGGGFLAEGFVQEELMVMEFFDMVCLSSIPVTLLDSVCHSV